MFLGGDGGMFDITPPEGVNFASFLIRVKNPALLDYEKVKGQGLDIFCSCVMICVYCVI